MEKNIKILEEMCNEIIKKDDCNLFETLSPLEIALKVENLIKGYRELEEENKELKEYIFVAPNLDEITAVKYSHIQRDAYFRGRAEEQQKAEQIIYENYIPKSKIKEKIEELEKKIDEIRKENRVKQNATKYDYLIVGKRDGLKELLEEK